MNSVWEQSRRRNGQVIDSLKRVWKEHSWFKPWVWVILLSSSARHRTLAVPFTSQGYRWVPSNCQGSLEGGGEGRVWYSALSTIQREYQDGLAISRDSRWAASRFKCTNNIVLLWNNWVTVCTRIKPYLSWAIYNLFHCSRFGFPLTYLAWENFYPVQVSLKASLVQFPKNLWFFQANLQRTRNFGADSTLFELIYIQLFSLTLTLYHCQGSQSDPQTA